jgi:hypothetical protein
MPVEHSPTKKVLSKSNSLKTNKTEESGGSKPISPNQTVISQLNISLSPIKPLNIKLKPEPHIVNKPKLVKMSTSLSEISKFAKLVGDYNVDCSNVSIRSHLARLETLATIGQWDNGVKI